MVGIEPADYIGGTTFTFCHPDTLSNSEAHTSIDQRQGFLLDMDVASSYTRSYDESSESSSSQVFEFNVSLSAENAGERFIMSPADDLFYKGQLLPLLLPPRLQMVEHLSGLNTKERVESNFHCFTSSGDDIVQHTEDELVPNVTTEQQIQQPPREAAEQGGCPSPGTLDRKSFGYGRTKNFHTKKSHPRHLENRSLLLYVEDPSIFPHCYKDPVCLCPPESNAAGGQVKVRKDKISSTSELGSRGTGVRWKVLFKGMRRGRKCCSDAGDCKSAKARCPKQLGTSNGISTAPVVSSGSSCRNLCSKRELSTTCRSFEEFPQSDKANHRAENPIASTGLQTDGLVVKARDCLHRSLKILKSVTIAQKENDLKTISQGHQVADQVVHMQPELPKIDRARTMENTTKGLERSCAEAERSSKKWKYVNDGLDRVKAECESDLDLDSGTTSSMRQKTPSSQHLPIISSCSGLNAEGFISIDPHPSCDCFPLDDQDNSSISNQLARPTCRKIVSQSTMIEFQSAIQGAIAHCKQSQGGGTCT